jgi:hypothetical protein
MSIIRRVPTAARLGALALLLLPALAVAQEARRDSTAHLRIGGDVTVPTGGREGAVVVLRGDAIIGGEVRGVVVIEGDARVIGGRVHELTVIRGRAILSDSARVEGDVHLLDADLTVEPGAFVAGRVERGVGRRVARHLAGGVALVGLGVLLAFVLAGMFAASVFPESLRATGLMIRGETGIVLLATAVVWLAFPIAAGLLIPTLVGLPLGLGYFFFILPALAFLGLVVSGTWLGDLLLRRLVSAERPVRPTLAAALGVTLLLLVGRIPILGIIATALILLGTGAIAVRTLRAMRAPGAGPAPAPGASI